MSKLINLTCCFLAISLGISTGTAQVLEIQRLKNFKFSQVIPIQERNKLAGYLFLFKKNKKHEDQVEFVATDMHFNEVKRGIYSEREYKYFRNNYLYAVKTDSTIYLKNQLLYHDEKNFSFLAPIAYQFGFTGGFIYGLIFSLSTGPEGIPKLNLLREINLQKETNSSYEKRLHFHPTVGLNNQFLISHDSLMKIDYLMNIYPDNQGILAMYSTYGEKNYYSDDSIYMMGSNHLIKWKAKIREGNAGKKYVSSYIKNFNYFNNYLVINNVAEIKDRNFGTYITFYNKESGFLNKELDINREFHAKINQYNEFKLINHQSNKVKLLLAGRSAVYNDLTKCNGIYLNFIDTNLVTGISKIISWKELNQYLTNIQNNYFSDDRSMNINNIYWFEDKILLILQEQTAIGFADLVAILMDEEFNIMDFHYVNQKSRKKIDIPSSLYFEGDSTTINLFRKEVSLEFNQLQVKSGKITIKKIEREVDFFYDFALEGINSVVFGGLDKKSGNVLLKEMKL